MAQSVYCLNALCTTPWLEDVGLPIAGTWHSLYCEANAFWLVGSLVRSFGSCLAAGSWAGWLACWWIRYYCFDLPMFPFSFSIIQIMGKFANLSLNIAAQQQQQYRIPNLCAVYKCCERNCIGTVSQMAQLFAWIQRTIKTDNFQRWKCQRPANEALCAAI